MLGWIKSFFQSLFKSEQNKTPTQITQERELEVINERSLSKQNDEKPVAQKKVSKKKKKELKQKPKPEYKKESKKEEMPAKCQITVLHKPKRGNKENEYEDAFKIPFAKASSGTEKFQVAIADGATESSFAKEWSQILVNNFSFEEFNSESITATLERLSKEWKSEVGNKSLAWYAEEKKDMGAFSAILGIEVDLNEKKVRGLAYGDCNLFLVRNDKLELSFPYANYLDFGLNPQLLSSKISQNENIQSEFHSINKEIRSQDIIILATDAIAAWFLKANAENQKPWEVIFERDENDDYEEWLNELREANELKNDDSTIIVLEFATL